MTTTNTQTLRHTFETPVFIAAKNKTCEPYNGESLPFKKIPAGALVKGFESSMTWYAVEVFTNGKIYRAKIKNFTFLNRSPVQDWPSLEPDAQPVKLQPETSNPKPCPRASGGDTQRKEPLKMKRFEPGKIYFYRYLSDNPWYSYIILKCVKRTEKTAVFQKTNGNIYRGRLKPTWREDGERVKLDGWIYLESPCHEFRPGLEDCNIETVQDAEALFAGLDDPQPAQHEQPEIQDPQPAPIIRLVTTSAAPYAVLVDD